MYSNCETFFVLGKDVQCQMYQAEILYNPVSGWRYSADWMGCSRLWFVASCVATVDGISCVSRLFRFHLFWRAKM